MLDVNDQPSVQSVVELGVTDAVLFACKRAAHPRNVRSRNLYRMIERLAERPILLYLCKHIFSEALSVSASHRFLTCPAYLFFFTIAP